MALSAAEKQRRYRERRDKDPVRRNEYLQKQRQKYRDDLAVGKKKHVADMSERELRKTRRKWRKKKTEYRKRKRDEKPLEDLLPTPDVSPNTSPTRNPLNTSNRGKNIERKRNRERAKCYRDNDKLRKEIENQNRLINNLRRQINRNNSKMSKKEKADTPRTKTRKLLKNFRAPYSADAKKVKRALFHHFILTETLKNKYRKGGHAEKKTYADLLRGQLLKKYGLVNSFRKEMGFHSGTGTLRRKGCLTTRLKKRIQLFFHREDNSRTTAGIKETVTKNKVKKQRRILLTTLDRFAR